MASGFHMNLEGKRGSFWGDVRGRTLPPTTMAPPASLVALRVVLLFSRYPPFSCLGAMFGCVSYYKGAFTGSVWIRRLESGVSCKTI